MGVLAFLPRGGPNSRGNCVCEPTARSSWEALGATGAAVARGAQVSSASSSVEVWRLIRSAVMGSTGGVV
jgi:hypothetical protein